MSSAETVVSLLQALGIAERATRVAENVWALQKGRLTVQIVAAPEFVIVTAVVAPRVPGSDREALYASLLKAQTQLLGAFFTLEADGAIRVNQIIPSPWLQDRELAFLLSNVGQQAEVWSGRLAAPAA